MLVVTGPPRSGTSLVCNLLQQMGCDFGDDGLLIAGNQWNELGYFENTEIVSMNHRLTIGAWIDPEPWTVSVWPDSRRERLRRMAVLAVGRATLGTKNVLARARKMKAELEDLEQRYADCCVKDPRFCFTLPAWHRSVDRVLFCVRHPREVADSMARQSGFHRVVGYYGWHRWQSWFFRHQHSVPVHMVDYNRLVRADGFEEEIRRLYAFAGRDFDASRAAEIGERVIRDDLHHNRADQDPLPPFVNSAYRELQRRHREAAPLEEPTCVAATGG